MEMDDLNKTQLILLALMVSFVTSIATGIITVTLMDQAPPGVSHTVNRIIERTIEKVVPDEGSSIITKEKTIVIKEEDLVQKAVSQNIKNLVRLGIETEVEEGEGLLNNIGVGFFANGPTHIPNFFVTDSSLVQNEVVYRVIDPQVVVKLKVSWQDEMQGIALMEGFLADGDIVIQYIEEPTFKPRVSFIRSNKVKLGQAVVLIGGKDNDLIATANISEIIKINIPLEDSDEEKELITGFSLTSGAGLSKEFAGGLLLNLDGEIIGMNVIKEGTITTISGDMIGDILSELKKEDEKDDENNS